MSKYWTATTREGRQKGAINLTHALARQGIAKVYKLLGGEQGLWQWCQASEKNKTMFYTQLLPKLIPAEIADQHGDNRIQVVILPAKSTKSNDIKEIEVGQVTGTGDAVSIDHATEPAQSLPMQE